MRLLVAAILCCLVLLSSPASGEQIFPYTTIVTTDDVYVRSGPGQNYYPTDKLKRGQEIEVYRHDPGGWCAIRPVDGSFTWVSGRFLKPTEDKLAVVTENGVSARVGSRFSDVREVVQVRLQKGEVVEVLEGPPQGGRGSEGWFKIAPPSGEFRWVSGKYLDADYPRDGLRRPPPAEQQPRRHHGHADDERVDLDSGSSAPVIPAAAVSGAESAEAAGESLRARSSRPRSLTAEEYQAELQRIELELSVMVIEEPTAWSFDSLHERTNLLLDQAQTAVERGRARLLANKIARFDDLKQRQDAVLAMRDQTDRNSRLWAHLRPKDIDRDGEGERPAPKLQIDDRFDGVGQLTQVVSPKLGAPRYALVDEAGAVRCYVTPAPGVNLHNYIGRQVGVTGTRGHLLEQHASHIMARHVTPLEGTMLR
jgi:SH3-like domain-containing protein